MVSPLDLFNARLDLNIKIKILSYLSSGDLLTVVPRVCKAWQELSKNPSLWTRMEVVGCNITPGCVVTQLTRSPLMTSFSLGSLARPDENQILTAVANSCPELEVLKLRDCCHLTQDTLDLLVQGCPKLRVVDFWNYEVTGMSKNELDVLSGASKLTEVIMHRESTDVLLESLRYGAWGLEVLGTTQSGIPQETHLFLDSVGGQLLSLSVDWDVSESFCLQMSVCRMLSHLSLFKACNMTDQSFLNGIGKLTNLRQLRIEYGVHLSLEAVREFLSRKEVVGRLERLELIHVKLDRPCFKAIATNCKSLTTLGVSYTKAMTLPDLKGIGRIPTLKQVDIWYSTEQFQSSVDSSSCFEEEGPWIRFRKTLHEKLPFSFCH